MNELPLSIYHFYQYDTVKTIWDQSEAFVCRIVENDFVKSDWRSRGLVHICQYMLMKWILCFLVGHIVGLLGFFINLAVENVAGMKFVVTSNMMLARK